MAPPAKKRMTSRKPVTSLKSTSKVRTKGSTRYSNRTPSRSSTKSNTRASTRVSTRSNTRAPTRTSTRAVPCGTSSRTSPTQSSRRSTRTPAQRKTKRRRSPSTSSSDNDVEFVGVSYIGTPQQLQYYSSLFLPPAEFLCERDSGDIPFIDIGDEVEEPPCDDLPSRGLPDLEEQLENPSLESPAPDNQLEDSCILTMLSSAPENQSDCPPLEAEAPSEQAQEDHAYVERMEIATEEKEWSNNEASGSVYYFGQPEHPPLDQTPVFFQFGAWSTTSTSSSLDDETLAQIMDEEYDEESQ